MKGIKEMNAYEKSLTQALQKVLEKIAESGVPTCNQLLFLQLIFKLKSKEEE